MSTIGTSGTGERTQEYLASGDKAKALSTIGQFGIGLLSAFVVAEQIEVVTRGDVRRAKLYYLRDLRGKAAKIKEKRETPAARRAVRPTAALEAAITEGPRA